MKDAIESDKTIELSIRSLVGLTMPQALNIKRIVGDIEIFF